MIEPVGLDAPSVDRTITDGDDGVGRNDMDRALLAGSPVASVGMCSGWRIGVQTSFVGVA